MKKLFALTTIIVLLAVVIPASAAPPVEKQCDIWIKQLEKIPPNSPNYQPVLNNLKTNCSEHLVRYALIALYESTDGDNWFYNFGWSTEAYHCSWFGIHCFEDPSGNHIFDIYLANNNLNGSIPPEIGYLSNLYAIYLYDNPQLTGSIPPEFGNLNQLVIFWMTMVSLGGPIPDTLINLTQLDSFLISSSDDSLCVSTQGLLDFFNSLEGYFGPDKICTQ